MGDVSCFREMAESMGDVSPKEALAQRVISLGKSFLSADEHQRAQAAVTHEGLKGPALHRMYHRYVCTLVCMYVQIYREQARVCI